MTTKRVRFSRSVRKRLRRMWPVCPYCGVEYMTSTHYQFSIDHVLPLSQGGTHDADNLLGCCQACNRSKGIRTPEQWAADILAYRKRAAPTD